jgi:hypothetical protein
MSGEARVRSVRSSYLYLGVKSRIVSLIGWTGDLGHQLPYQQLRAELPPLPPYLPATQAKVCRPTAYNVLIQCSDKLITG